MTFESTLRTVRIEMIRQVRAGEWDTEKMVAMPPDPTAVSARTLRESCLPGRCGPRAAPIIETRGCSCLVQARKLGEKPRQALRKRKAQAPCDCRPSRARIHIAAWFHRP